VVLSKLRGHFETNHAEYQGKDTHFLKTSRESLENCKHSMMKIAKPANKYAVEESYRVRYRTALAGVKLIKLCAKDIVTCTLNAETGKKSMQCSCQIILLPVVFRIFAITLKMRYFAG
jgi:hypothetical protein